ncbi:tetratricopeptide repeat protein [Dyadobacter tibetensis]|uniref:tetratricopeptide repeat protein n=1 Tax=Dyadobacter tibetensis TaxID=1211851 RepID=UPI000470FA5F|nr:tetratricopeptide repeat protein [Dyadobacter tibetensis]
MKPYLSRPSLGLLIMLILEFLSPASAEAKAISTTVAFTPELQKAYFEIQKLRLQGAREIIERNKQTDPNNTFVTYLENYADLHYLLISEDKQAFKSMLAQQEKRLEHIDQLPDNSPYKRFFQAEIRVHWAFAKLKFGSQVSGAWEVIKAYRLLEENRKRFPDFLPTLKTLGLLHILIGSVPDQYGWVTRILGLNGSTQQGLAEIQTVIRQEPLFRQEAQLINILIHAYTLTLPPSLLNQLLSLTEEQPDNLLLHFFATTTLIKEARGSQASKVLAQAPTGKAYISFPFLEYLRGELALQKGQYAVAKNAYSQFLTRYKGFNYIKDANFKLFIADWLTDQENPERYLLKVRSTGSAVIEADQFALRMAGDYEKGILTTENKVLFKARYASDGGYFQDAWDILAPIKENNFSSAEARVEYLYRKGRILQKTGQNSQAIPYYQRAIAAATEQSAGLGASSALQLGYIYMGNKDKKQATIYFKKALSYKKHDYKNSIDNKARASLTAMKE